MVSSPFRAILLLSFSSPRRRTPFILQVQGACERTARPILEIYCEESRDVALVVVHVLEPFTFNICIV